MVCSSLEDGANDEDEASSPDWPFASIAICYQTGEDGSDQCATTSKGCDKLLFAGGELVAERCANTDED